MSGVAERAEAKPVRRARLRGTQVTPGLLARLELQANLDQLVTKRVTIVSAPAGSGKTSLLRAWAPSWEHRLAFVSVERDQRDDQLFWWAVLDALGVPAPGTREKSGGEPVNGDSVIDRVLAAMLDPEEPVALIIDDLHELCSAEALSQLERLLLSLPHSSHVILSSRRDPRLRLHQLRLADEVGEIRARELDFTEGEARELLRASGVALSDEGAAALWRRTEGWAAGLRLAAISLAGHPDPDLFVEEFSGGDRAVGEYLLAEMLERQPGDVQGMLLRTSIVPRMSGELADLLAGRGDSERILLELEDANAFVVSLDRQRTWFRYHQLLADFLRLELRRTLADEVPDLHRVAAGWFADHGHVLDAVSHLLAAGDWPDAAKLLADHLFDLALDGQQGAIAVLLRSFPSGVSAKNPNVALAHATSELAQGRVDEAAAHLAVAEANLDSTVSGRGRGVRASIVSSRLALARRRGHFAQVIEQAEPLTSTGPGEPTDFALDSDLRATALMNLGIAEMWSGQLGHAERHLRQGAELAQKLERAHLELACRTHLGFASQHQSLSTARYVCHEAIGLAERHEWDDRPVVAPALATLASTSIAMGEFDEGARWLQRAWKSVEQNLDPADAVLLRLVSAMLHAGRGEQARSLEQLELAEESQALVEGEHVLAAQVSASLALTHVRQGQPEQARTFLVRLPTMRADTGEIRVAQSAICLAEGDADGALEALQTVLDGTNAVIHTATLVEARLIAGLAQLKRGRRPEAQAAVEAALAAAEPERLMFAFLVTDSLALLETVTPHDTAHRALLIELREVLGGAPTARAHHEWVGSPEPLSPSELRVLRYLPTNLTRGEIAGELYVSVNTVNTHIRNIYSKLGARGRSSAVDHARELQLLAGAGSR
ncbi:MAG TPA: LuxR C-terminal-related transcriptional regulator [Solirubrobacteraceae bacterium]|jgi:LuxR family maltose regulon positive regulatory protein|nr:LuxR C-terminal-related transcriptional regulator [Solirubrobacteraceae bacterium]